jgi:Bacteriocin-protection, YdeI or OmpD-Associated/Domain of unknown function (DUF1905)
MAQTLELETTLEPHGPAAAVVLTDEQVATLGAGKTPPVRVTVNGVTVGGRVMRRGGQNLVGFSRAARVELGVEPGQSIRLTIELDDQPREVEVPDDLAAALDADPAARAAFDALAFTHRKEYVRSVVEAKKPETRERRVRETVARVLG